MELYHGSNVIVKKPTIFISNRKLDFGGGFYLTSSLEQAQRWAKLKFKRRKRGKAFISIFEFDENNPSLKILKFNNPSKEWLGYVSNNRNRTDFHDDYDIVIGPVANDVTSPVLKLYFTGVYDEEETIKRLLPQRLKDQYAFKTNKALNHLKFKGVK